MSTLSETIFDLTKHGYTISFTRDITLESYCDDVFMIFVSKDGRYQKATLPAYLMDPSDESFIIGALNTMKNNLNKHAEKRRKNDNNQSD